MKAIQINNKNISRSDSSFTSKHIPINAMSKDKNIIKNKVFLSDQPIKINK
jgi:hypothetical protein